MRLENAKLDQALGAILVHNQADSAGRRVLNKGRQLTAQDIAILQQAGRNEVFVARLEPGDVRENEAALRLAMMAAGLNVTLTVAAGGRVNLLAGARGLVLVDTTGLNRLNSLQGVTLATRPGYSLTEIKKIVATVKTIGLALPGRTLEAAEETVAESGPIVSVRTLPPGRVAVILTGTPQARQRVEATFAGPIAGRVEELGSAVVRSEYVSDQESEIAAAVERAAQEGATCIILAGETSIMDESDVTPSGLRQAGATIELYGAPVEPGNLLLLAYLGSTPIIGAPGCVKSRETNVVDLILPRLLSGEHVTRADVIALANGGLVI